MSLIEIKSYMVRVRMASLASLCAFFQTDPDTLRCLLAHWVRKGNIRQCQKTPACGSKCFKCPILSTEIYEWIDSAAIL